MKKTKYGDYEDVLPVPTFLYEIRVVFTDDISRSTNPRVHVFKEFLSNAEAGGSRALHVAVPDGTSYLFFRLGKHDKREDWAAPGIIAHEAYHAVYAMLKKWAGVKELDEEVVAYHLTYVVKHIHNIKSKIEEAEDEPIHSTQGKSGGLQSVQSTTTGDAGEEG